MPEHQSDHVGQGPLLLLGRVHAAKQQHALRVVAKVDSTSHVETLTLSFPAVDGKKATLQIHWGTRAVTLPIEVP